MDGSGDFSSAGIGAAPERLIAAHLSAACGSLPHAILELLR